MINLMCCREARRIQGMGKLGMLSFRGVIKWNRKTRNVLRVLNQERGHCCGKASATGMSLPNVRFWEGAVGDPEKHISYCLQAAPAHFPAQEFFQHHCRFLLRAIQRDNQSRVPQFPNSAQNFMRGCIPAHRSEQTTLIPLVDLPCHFTSWPNFLCSGCLGRHNIPGECSD